jgi:hypothetical protein
VVFVEDVCEFWEEDIGSHFGGFRLIRSMQAYVVANWIYTRTGCVLFSSFRAREFTTVSISVEVIF